MKINLTEEEIWESWNQIVDCVCNSPYPADLILIKKVLESYLESKNGKAT